MLYNGTWGTISGSYWDLNDADVVCRQLGHDGALSAPRYTVFGRRTGPIWLDHVQCEGEETSITQCIHRIWGVHSYWPFSAAGVACRPKGRVTIRALFIAIFTKNVKSQTEHEKDVAKFDSNKINLSFTDDGKPTNLGILRTLE